MTILPNSGSTQVTPAELTSEASVCTHSDPLLSPQAPATLPTFLAHLLNSDHRTIVTNIWSLSLITIATYIFPLIVLPYVTRVLGPRAFGAIALLLAAAQNCCLVVNYGFGFTASRNVAIQKDNPAALSRILSCTIATKLLLLVLCVVLSACVFEAIPSFRQYLRGFACAFLMAVASVIYPDWFFQGLEKMKWLTVFTIVPKLVITPLIFVLVKSDRDVPMYLLLMSVTHLLSGALGLIVIFLKFDCHIVLPSLQEVIRELRDGFHVFMSCTTTTVYGTLNIFLLGFMAGPVSVGYYSAGQRLVVAVQSLWASVPRALYPYFARRFVVSDQSGGRSLRWIFPYISSGTFFLSCLLSVLGPKLIPAYLGSKFRPSVVVFQILAFTIWSSASNNLLGVQGLLASGRGREFLRAMLVGAMCNFVVAPVGIAVWGNTGLAMAVLLVDITILVYEAKRLRHLTVW
jgi:PST family polysaccharide transporter